MQALGGLANADDIPQHKPWNIGVEGGESGRLNYSFHKVALFYAKGYGFNEIAPYGHRGHYADMGVGRESIGILDNNHFVIRDCMRTGRHRVSCGDQHQALISGPVASGSLGS
ncbi:MAG: hypothetical protein PHG34_08310 [Candidatus Cloacimonetes bacterium]|nr:hypothetical protein [Candidatus Cloacimonadota bacterium]